MGRCPDFGRPLLKPKAPAISSPIVRIFVAMRTIRRYVNRKFYDTEQHRYVNLSELAQILRDGEEIRVLEHHTGSDITSRILTEILYTEAVRGTSPVSPRTLRRILVSGLAIA